METTMAIQTSNLVKRFKDKTAVDHVNLEVRRGELFALLGTNGAGKTTTIKMLTSLIAPTSGEAVIDGKNLLTEREQVKAVVNVSPQETAVAPNLSVRENLEFIAGVYDIKDRKGKAQELIDMFKLTEVAKQRAKTLSGGWQRRLSIAMSLVNEPRLLFLDEPTLGLDVIARRELWEIISALKGRITIVLTTHYMEEAEELSDRVGIMAQGKLLCVGTAQELINKAGTKNFEEAFVKLATGGVQ